MFLRKITIDYMRYGYVRYVLRHIPEGKDLEAIDRKLIRHYGVTSCRTKRMRLRRQNQAVVQYIRFGWVFVLLATEGTHEQFEKVVSKDARSHPLQFGDYSVGFCGGTPCVRVRRKEWKAVKQRFEKIGLHSLDEVERKINSLPYCNFPGVVRQKLELAKAINTRRKRAGLARIKLALPSKHNERKSNR